MGSWFLLHLIRATKMEGKPSKGVKDKDKE